MKTSKEKKETVFVFLLLKKRSLFKLILFCIITDVDVRGFINDPRTDTKTYNLFQKGYAGLLLLLRKDYFELIRKTFLRIVTIQQDLFY